MSSPQVLDTKKALAHYQQQLADADREKHNKAADEAIAKQKAAVEGMDGNVLTTNAEAQLGRFLTRQQIIGRLSRLNANLVFEQSINAPSQGGVYVLDPTANLDAPDPRNRGRRFIVGMEWTGVSPEFTTRKIEIDQWGKPQMRGQIRGWRTVLVRLIKNKLIGVAEAERVFSIAKGRDSQRWYEVLS